MHLCHIHSSQNGMTYKWHDLQMAWITNDMTYKWHELQMTWLTNDMTYKWHDLQMTWLTNDMTYKWHDLQMLLTKTQSCIYGAGLRQLFINNC